ncbi:MAG TPA: polysaccharide biosynthesis/export family protein [Paracoccaceae bacterium]|nr:polysaccharide biosynthesis/export family protein [Paracoccaceae bacterium]
MMRTPIQILCALILIAGIAVLGSAGESVAEIYAVKPGDIVEVTVIEDSSLNRRVLVGPDGRISVPLAGSVEAAGRTLPQIERALQTALEGNFVRPPTVSVALVSLGPPELLEEELEEIVIHSVYVVGEVLRPGRYEYDAEKPISVLQAITLAGGPGVFANRKKIQVRDVDGTTETLAIYDYKAVEKGIGAAGLGMTLSDGAVIVVPERGIFD